MNILFLDIDGVLNVYQGKPDCFSKEAVDVINKITKEYHLNIVISSSWRESFTFEELETLFKENGIEAKIVDKTPIFIGNLTREFVSIRDEEIKYYLRTHNINNFCIVDDYAIRYPELVSHFVQTDYETGLIKKDLPKIEKILNID